MGSRIELNWLLTTYFISKVLVTYSKYVHTYDAKKDSEIDCRLYADNVFFFFFDKNSVKSTRQVFVNLHNQQTHHDKHQSIRTIKIKAGIFSCNRVKPSDSLQFSDL